MSNATADTITRAEHDAALAAARAEGARQATERIRLILMHSEARGREAMAMVFALDSDMSPAAVIKILAASPTTVAPTRPTLDQRQNPAVAADRPSRH